MIEPDTVSAAKACSALFEPENLEITGEFPNGVIRDSLGGNYYLLPHSSDYTIEKGSIMNVEIPYVGCIGSKWEEFNDELLYKPDIRVKGTFAQKPVSSQGIYQGFSYFCTDKQTTEGSRNGIMIYYAGDDTWTDALGRYIH